MQSRILSGLQDAGDTVGVASCQNADQRGKETMKELTRSYKPLAISSLAPHTGYARPFFYTQNQVKPSSSALEVMTDLQFVPAGTIHADIDVDTATQKMIARGVRMLLVTDSNDDVIGLITSRDLLGERATNVMNDRGIPLGEVKVSDIMTVGECIEVLEFKDVLHAHVGDIVETLKHSGRQHAVVVEPESFSGKPVIRGIFSASQIARQLGVRAQTQEISETFAEIDRAMSALSAR